MDAPSNQFFVPSTPKHWAAQLRLKLIDSAGSTRIGKSEHRGPLRIQRPFYPEQNGTAHVYILHPPGGVAGGDHLHLEVECEPGSRTLITTPAANKLYRSKGVPCRILQRISARDGAIIEWLPQESIAFDGARAELSTIVELEEGAEFIGWELLCLGRPAAGERYRSGFINQRVEVWQEEVPLYVDRLRLGGLASATETAWGLGGQCLVGTCLFVTRRNGLSNLLREVIDARKLVGRAATTDLQGLTALRYVGSSVEEAWDLYVRAWEAVRPVVTGSSAIRPRIWDY